MLPLVTRKSHISPLTYYLEVAITDRLGIVLSPWYGFLFEERGGVGDGAAGRSGPLRP